MAANSINTTHFIFIGQLYNAIYQFVLKSPRYAELTVEDPSEDFEDLRDKADLKMLLGHKEFIKEAYGAYANGANDKARLSVGRDAKANRRAANNEDAAVQEKERAGTKASGVAMLGPPTKKKWAERWRKELKLAKVRAPSAKTISKSSVHDGVWCRSSFVANR